MPLDFDAAHCGSARRHVLSQEVLTQLCPPGVIVFLWHAWPGKRLSFGLELIHIHMHRGFADLGA